MRRRAPRIARVPLAARFCDGIRLAFGVKAAPRERMPGGGEGAWDGMARLYDGPRRPGAI